MSKKKPSTSASTRTIRKTRGTTVVLARESFFILLVIVLVLAIGFLVLILLLIIVLGSCAPRTHASSSNPAEPNTCHFQIFPDPGHFPLSKMEKNGIMPIDIWYQSQFDWLKDVRFTLLVAD